MVHTGFLVCQSLLEIVAFQVSLVLAWWCDINSKLLTAASTKLHVHLILHERGAYVFVLSWVTSSVHWWMELRSKVIAPCHQVRL